MNAQERLLFASSQIASDPKVALCVRGALRAAVDGNRKAFANATFAVASLLAIRNDPSSFGAYEALKNNDSSVMKKAIHSWLPTASEAIMRESKRLTGRE